MSYPPSLQIIHLSQTDSTNLEARRHLPALTGNTPTLPLLVWADYQTAGRGQKGNHWEGEAGKNLLFTLVVCPHDLAAHEQFCISQATALGLYDALKPYAKPCSIKWPNDIYAGDRKVCGILIENILSHGQISHSLIGIGLNVNQEHFTSNAPNPVSLCQLTGHLLDRGALLCAVVNRISERLKFISLRQPDLLRQEYADALYRHDGYYRYRAGGIDFEARILGVEDDGHILLEEPGGKRHRYTFKEVHYLFPDRECE